MSGDSKQPVDVIQLDYGPKGRAAPMAMDARVTVVLIVFVVPAAAAGFGAILALGQILLDLSVWRRPNGLHALILVGSAALSALLALTGQQCVRWLQRRTRNYWLYCEQCGYDLRASADHCPECGTFLPAWQAELVRQAIPKDRAVATNDTAAARLEAMLRPRPETQDTTLEA